MAIKQIPPTPAILARQWQFHLDWRSKLPLFFVHPPIADKVRQTPNANKKEKKIAGRLMGLVTKD